VLNNKGKPVRQYEPFFTATPEFEFARAAGVSPVLFYDPADRAVATLNPDGGYAKTTFDPWYQEAWDPADTVLLDPRDDPDVAGNTARYLAVLTGQPGGWATWYARRADGGLGRAAQRAAKQSARHAAGTPTRSYFDSLGRTFLTVEHNRVPATAGGGLADQYCRTRSLRDIQGNEHEVRDALGRAVMRYGFAMLGGQVSRAGLDTGGGQALPDVTGKTIYARNSRGFTLRTEYDALRRPVRTFVAGPGITGEALQNRTEYGESVTDPQARNLRTRVARQFDGAGIATSSAYDFTGNLLGSRRQFAAEYAGAVVNWASNVPLEDREYTASTSYDALNRPASMTTPDGSVLQPSYDPAGLLDRLDGRLRGATATTAFAERIEYNARGQRTLLRYGNGTSTAYTYDPLTFRVNRMVTLRGARRLQDLRYTYDAAGNPTQVSDRAQQQSYFRNQVVRPSAHYAYDALYRLIEATGREHLGQGDAGMPRPAPPGATDAPLTGLAQPGDGTAMARYIERYAYDEVGNLLLIRHRSADPAHGGWTRAYHYDEPSLLEPGRHGNRLTGTGPPRDPAPPQRLRYDEQGNTTSMPQIPLMRWDYADRLQATARHAGPGDGADPRDTTYYVYDAAGQRARKVTCGAAAARKSERLYLGAFEIYREYDTDGAVRLERETLNVFDDKHRLALAETRTAGTDRGPGELIRYQLANHLDSAVLELDQDARVISYEEYYPYGSTSYQAVRSGIEAPKRYRYAGKERDEQTGLYYYGARYYAPWLARWTAVDPAGIKDGPNGYAYCRDNPVRLMDPDGRQSDDDLAGLGTTHNTPVKAAAASGAAPPKPAPAPAQPKADPGKKPAIGRSTVPGRDNLGDLPPSPGSEKTGSDVQLQTPGPTQNAWVPRAIRPYSTLEATGSGLLASPTDPRQGWTGQGGGGLQARFTLNPNTEIGLGGTYGRIFTLSGAPLSGPANVGSAFGMLHLSQAQPPDADTEASAGFGGFLAGGAAFGAGPAGQTGWFASGTGAYSLSWPDNSFFQGLDVNAGVAASAYNQLNGVYVGNSAAPFASFNLTLPGHVNFEAYGSVPVGTGGNLSDPTSTATPFSGRLGAGLGIQFPLGDYAVGVEAGATGEWANVRGPGAGYSNISPWLNISIGAVNRRVDFSDPSLFPARY
jgi:RHS repeat-associated protein